MNTVLLYGSTHGTTKKIVKKLQQTLKFECDIFDVKKVVVSDFLLDYELLLFVCPTYGDEELQEDMEEFLQNLKFDLSSKRYVICETGNYYGYDSFEFGAKKLIEDHVRRLGAEEAFVGLSLDTLPRIDWESLAAWVQKLNRKINDE